MKFVLYIFLCLIAISPVQQNQDKILFFDSFEKDNFKSKWPHVEACCNYSISLVDSLKKSGKKSVRFELNNTDPIVQNGKRAELLMNSEDSSDIERWYRFDVYLPDTYEADSLYEVVAQWHETPDFHLGETWRSPPISLRIIDNQWKLYLLWSDKPVNSNKTVSGSKIIPLDTCKKGRWIEWIFHIKYAYNDNGVIEIWENDKKIMNYHGPNYYNDKKGPFFKIGIYKPEWRIKTKNLSVTKRVLFFDNVAIGSDKADRQLMKDVEYLYK